MGPYPRITAVAIFALFCGACRSSSPDSTDSKNRKFVSDQFMERMKVQSYGNSGLEWELTAPRADVFSNQSKTVIQNLQVDLYNHSQKSTTVTADEGLLFSGEDLPSLSLSSPTVVLEPGDMFLSGHVIMVSTEGNHLATEWAHYKKKSDLIVSDAPVTVTRPDSVTHGVGLEATTDLSKVRIFNQTLVIRGDSYDKKK